MISNEIWLGGPEAVLAHALSFHSIPHGGEGALELKL